MSILRTQLCPHQAKASKGFSLVEIIVVIAVISLLALLIGTIYPKVRASSESIQCAANLRHLYISTLSFVNDHDGKLPPDLGKAGVTDVVDSRFKVNQYWWGINYLGRYVLDQPSRRRDAAGQILVHEAEMYFNCPSRYLDGPDHEWMASNSTYPGGARPRITYLMNRLPRTPESYNFYAIDDKSNKLLYTEGVSSSLTAGGCKTGKLGSKDSQRRLRRYHNDSLYILFMDGRLDLFSGTDEKIAEWL